MRKTRRSICLAAASLLTLPLASLAQDAGEYPAKPVRIVVPLPPGSIPDLLGRAIGMHLQATLKQPFVVENRAGASTLLAARTVANAPADGYTLMVPTVTTLSLAPQLITKGGIDPLKDLSAMALLGATNFFLCVHPSFPARSMKEWIEAVRKNPGKYTYASTGNGSPHHIFMELLKKQLNLDIVHVPYNGSEPSMLDLLSGKVDMAFLSGVLGIGNIKAGKLFGLGMSMAKRSVLLDTVPPIADTVPGFDWSGWIAFGGPANLPAPVVTRIADEIGRLQATPQYRELLLKTAMEPLDPVPAARMPEFVRNEYRRWGAAIKASGVTVE
jgi:tripartite-type tricarboxylate transporter receptor subunit TctC